MSAAVPSPGSPEKLGRLGRTLASVVLVFGLAWLVRLLDRHVPDWLTDITWVKSIEFPVYAIAVGLIAGAVLAVLGLREHLAAAVRTELYIKTGLVLLGASINLAVIAQAALPAIGQSILLIAGVFLFAWVLGGLLGLEPKLRAVLAAGVSICGVSAAIAAAAAVAARREQLAYVAGLVILFALPSIFVQPWLAAHLGVPEPVAGAWIGGNIDTTAAVTAAAAIVGEDALKIAAIVKQTQNALMGVVAFLLTVYFVLRIERRPGVSVEFGALWTRFPKFILGFLAASAIATVYLSTATDPKAAVEAVRVAGTELRSWAFILAFVCIGLEFRVGALRAAGLRPVAVFAAATAFNLGLAFALANVFFGGFRLG